ncbi:MULTISPECIES: hypothetical protein [unclassified Streptomyces]|uniref:hypothetical protein n=1 Tax=unclassified Streptomyces TaxID=2593676 RepID=UPI000A4D6346|nr:MULTISPECIES: hypothetical protein [unclassified Streptomyces]MDX3768917.1 hypothetical protein [Streptomyces sp. AK08-01B]MDX3815679.1 hypothetical protein [Streptomyces sp. AK08-01A]
MLVGRAFLLYRQQTKNLLVSYSPKELGFFRTRDKGAWPGQMSVRRPFSART